MQIALADLLEPLGAPWNPVWDVLEGHFTLVLASPGQVSKNVPGRKTAVNDALWLTDLLARGFFRAGFVSSTAVQELRPFTRTRKQLVRASHAQRIQKIRTDANIKLGNVIGDVLGKSRRAVLLAFIDGHDDPKWLASCVNLVNVILREPIEALCGRVNAHRRFMVRLHLGHIDTLDKAIAQIEREVGLGLDPFRQAARPLSRMIGLSSVRAHVFAAAIGIDMSRFATPAHLLSWACLCRRNDESAGKRRSTRLRRGRGWLKTTHLCRSLVGQREGQEQLLLGAVPSCARPPRRKEGQTNNGLGLLCIRYRQHGLSW